MAEQLGSAVLTLTVDDRTFNAGLQRAQVAAQGAGAAIRSALGTLGVATTAAATLGFIGKQITELDSAAAAVRTLGVDSDDLVARLKLLSVELGNNISAVDLTKAAYDVASSGFATAADATNILRASAVGAKGGFAEVGDVASAVTGVLNAYGKSSSEAGLLIDQFVQTQADGVITVRQYAAGIGNVASIAAASGISIQELNAAIATATLRGVPVAQTFTGLRQAISSIIKPSEQAKELAASLGIQFNVGALKAKGFGGVLADVQAKTGGAADKIAVLLGSVEAQAAVQPLLNDKLVKYNELLERQAQAAGAAANASDTNAKTISGGLQQIGTGFSNLAVTLDKQLTPLLGGFIKSLNDILVKLNQVSVLTPEKIRQREGQAADIAQQALSQSPDFNVKAFGGTPILSAVVAPEGLTLKYDGKTFKGSIGEIREQVLKHLLQKDLKAAGGSNAGQPTAVDAAARDQTQREEQQRLEAERQARIQISAELQKQAKSSREKLRDAQSLQGLQGVALQLAQQQLAIDKLRATEAEAIKEANRNLAAANGDRTEQSVVDAAAKVETAGLQLRIALIEGSTALEQSAREAARQLQQASTDLRNAQQLAATPTFSTGETGPARAALQQVQGIRQSIAQARQASADAARQAAQAFNNGLQGDALQVLIDTARAAGERLKGALVSGADALRLASSQAAEALKQARLELASIVSDPQGLNQYLPAQAGRDRIEQQLQALLPAFREAQRTFQQLTGFAAPEIRGATTTDVLNGVLRFIERVDREQRAVENVQLQGRSLEIINAELTTSNNNLATQIAALAAKNWSVNVNVAPNGSVSSNIGALNGTF